MIAGIASLIFIPLLAMAMAHVLWAFGSTWPVKDQKTLARTIAGAPDAARMPPKSVTALKAVALFGAGLWALYMTDEAGAALLTWGGGLLALVFLGRGLAGLTPWWRRRAPEEPYATFNRKLYTPLALAIGLGFAYLGWWRLQQGI